VYPVIDRAHKKSPTTNTTTISTQEHKRCTQTLAKEQHTLNDGSTCDKYESVANPTLMKANCTPDEREQAITPNRDVNSTEDKFSKNTCKCGQETETGPLKDKDNELKKDLPSSLVLEDMMLYFSAQAPILFTTHGFSYQKATYDVTFENLVLGTRTKSLRSYIVHVNLLKQFTKIILRNPQLYILRMEKEAREGRIDVRWQVGGTPRLICRPFVYFGWWNGYIDGTSLFYVNSTGLYYKHILMQMRLLPMEEKCPITEWFTRSRSHRPSLLSFYREDDVSVK